MEGVSGEGGEEDWGVDWVLWGGCWVFEESEVVVKPSEKNRMSPFYTSNFRINTKHFCVLSELITRAVLDKPSILTESLFHKMSPLPI